MRNLKPTTILKVVWLHWSLTLFDLHSRSRIMYVCATKFDNQIIYHCFSNNHLHVITSGVRRAKCVVITINHGRLHLAQDIDFLSLLHYRTWHHTRNNMHACRGDKKVQGEVGLEPWWKKWVTEGLLNFKENIQTWRRRNCVASSKTSEPYWSSAGIKDLPFVVSSSSSIGCNESACICFRRRDWTDSPVSFTIVVRLPVLHKASKRPRGNVLGLLGFSHKTLNFLQFNNWVLVL